MFREITDEGDMEMQWEGYLNTAYDFILLVEPEHFDIYPWYLRKTGKGKKAYGVGLIKFQQTRGNMTLHQQEV